MSQNNNHQNLKLPKNQLILPVTAVGLRPSTGRRFRNKYKYLFCSAPTAVIFTAFLGLFTLNFLQVFAPDNSYAATHTDEASGKYNNTEYSLTTTVSDLNLELTTLPTGTSSTYGSQTVNVKTNAPGGYILYMSTSGDLTNSNTSSDDKISSITGNNAALDTNTWGYTSDSLLSSASTALNTNPNEASEQSIWNKLPVSTDTSLTSVTSSSSATENDGENSTLYYGIKADSSLDDGDYQGTITYTTIANDTATDTLLSVSPTSGTAGTATTITITTSLMTTTSSISTSDITAKVGNYTCSSVSITSTAPLKFTCKTSTSLTANTYTVTATISKYGKTYTKTSAYTAITPKITNNMNMQDVTQAMCYNADSYDSKGTTYTLKDSRDGSIYTVRKLKDGNCWMTQNLRLINKTISSSDSNIPLNSNSNSVSFAVPASSSSSGSGDGYWCASDSAACDNRRVAQYNSNTTYGAYYNWYTATAGTGTYSTGSGVTATSSICPKSGSGNDSSKSWHLPTSNTTGEWYKLMVTNYGYKDSSTSSPNVADWTTTAINLPFSGDVSNGSLGYTTSDGYFWSSTANSSAHAYNTGVSSSKLLFAGTGYGSKYLGVSVRCVLSGT